MASSSRNVLSSAPSMAAQRVTEHESEELLMMFSTSPESPQLVHAHRHPTAMWPAFDAHEQERDVSATATTGKSRDYTGSTAAELSGFSYNSYALPMGEPFSNGPSPSRQFGGRTRGTAVADSDSPAASTAAFESSLPIERTQAISFTTQPHARNGNTSRPGPVRSLDSTFSCDSYATGITSPATSFDDDGPYSLSLDNQVASTSSNTKGKGKPAQIEELASRPFSEADGVTSLTTSSFQRMALNTRSHDVLGQYSPDVADLMPQFELERKAFDWGEFERSLCSSPGAGTSFDSPFSPIDSVTGGLGLTLSSSIASPVELTNIQWPQRDPHTDLEQSLTEEASVIKPLEGGDTVESSHRPVMSVVNEGIVARTASNRARSAISLYETSIPDSHRRSISYRTSVIDRDSGHIRARADSTAASIMSRPYSTVPSPRLKKRALTLPSWLSKPKEGKGSSAAGSPVEPGSLHSGGRDAPNPRSRKLYKEKARSQTIPPTFPFIVTPEAILQVPVNEVELMTKANTSIKPVEEGSLFETMLPREAKLFVLTQLIVVHQEDFERRLKEGHWSVAHASCERWVGKDAGMRELVKLSRVSTPWQSLALDGQLWQSFDLRAFPGLSQDLVLRIAQCAGAFVQHVNLQGHSQLKQSAILKLSSSISLTGSALEPSPPTTQLTTINLVACTSITTHSLHYLLYRSPRLRHLFVRGLDSVTNTTLTEILGPYCRELVSLDIRRCSNVNGSGLENFAEQCAVRASERDGAYPLAVLKIAGMKDVSITVWRKVGQAFPLLKVLDCSYCRDLTDDAFREFVAWPNPSANPVPNNWSQFSTYVELSSRDAGFDPGDSTKHWRRVTSLRHLNVSGCRRITDLTCSSLAFTTPKLEMLEIAGIRNDFHDEGLIRLLKTTPLIRKIDLEDATEITDAVLDCLIPEPRMPSPTTGRQPKEEQGPRPGEMLEHLSISYAVNLTPEAMARLIRGCKKLRVLEADNTRITGSIIRDFVSRRRHREKGQALSEGVGSEIVGTDCRAVSESSVRDIRLSTRPRRGWRGWEARDLGYEDGQSTGIMDASGVVCGPLIGQDECDERRVVVKSFHSWVAVDTVAEQKARLRSANGGGKTGNAELPRWLTQWSLGRRTPIQSTDGTPEEREDRGCIVQ